MKVSQRIKVARTARGMTQSDLAKAVGVSEHTAFNWERGVHRPRPRYIKRLAEVLGVDPIGLVDVERLTKNSKEA